MASAYQFRDLLDSSEPVAPDPSLNSKFEYGDYPREVAIGAENLGAGLMSLARKGSQLVGNTDAADVFKIYQSKLNREASGTEKNLSPAAKNVNFFENPAHFIALKGSQMAAPLIATMLPGGIINEALGATAGGAAAFTAGAAVNSGAFINDVSQRVDNASDDTLKDQSSYYRGLRNRMSASQAKDAYTDWLLNKDGRLALEGIVGGLANATGPIAAGGRILAGGKAVIGGAEKSFAGRALSGGLEGGAVMGVQSGVTNANTQNTNIDMGVQESFDLNQWALDVLGNATGGAAIGSILHGFMGGNKKSNIEKTDVNTPDAAQTAALNAAVGVTPEGVTPEGNKGDQIKKTSLTRSNSVTPEQLAALDNSLAIKPLDLTNVYEEVHGEQPTTTDNNQSGPGQTSRQIMEDIQNKRDTANIPFDQGEPSTGGDIFPPDRGSLKKLGYSDQQIAGMSQDQADRILKGGAAPSPLFEQEQNQEPVAPKPSKAKQATDDLTLFGQQNTVPESSSTIDLQRNQLINGDRAAVLYPVGQDVPQDKIPGMERITNQSGTWDYNPEKVDVDTINYAAASGNENRILELGDRNKIDVAKDSVATNSPPVAVVARVNGTESRAAMAASELAPKTKAVMEKTKKPGEKIAVEPVEDLLSSRSEPKKPSFEGVPDNMQEQAQALQSAIMSGDKGAIVKAESRFRESLPLDEARTAIKAVRDATEVKQKSTKTKDDLNKTARDYVEASQAGDQKAKAEAEAVLRKNLSDLGQESVFRYLDKLGDGVKLTKGDLTDLAAWLAAKEPVDKESSTAAAKSETKAQELARLKEEQAQDKKRGFITSKAAMDAETGERVNNEKNAGAVTSDKGELRTSGGNKSSAGRRIKKTEELAFSAEETLKKSEAREKAKTEEKKDAAAKDRAEKEAKVRAAGEARRGNNLDAEIKKVRDEARNYGIQMTDAQIIKQARANVEARAKAREAKKNTETVKSDLVTKAQKAARGEAVSEKISEHFFNGIFGKGEEAPKERVEPTIETGPKHAQEGLEFENDIHGKTADEVADHISKTSDNKSYRVIAKRVRDRIRELTAAGQKFGFTIVHPGDSVPGTVANALSRAKGVARSVYKGVDASMHVYVNGDEYRVQGNHGTTNTTVTHELVHAATMGSVRLGEIAPIGSDLNNHYRELADLFNTVVQHFNERVRLNKAGQLELNDFEKEIYSRDNNALANLDELVSWGLTSKQMQDYLRSIPAGKKTTMLSEFVRKVADLLGLHPNERNALTEVLRISENLMNTPIGDMKAVANTHGQSLHLEKISLHQEAGNFTSQGNEAHQQEVDQLFREPLGAAVKRGTSSVVSSLMSKVENPVSTITSSIRDIANNAGRGSLLKRVGLALETNDQFRQRKESLIPQARDVFDNIERAGVYSNKLKEEGNDIAAALYRASKMDPIGFEKFSELIQDQTMYGADATSPIGEGRNKHLEMNQYVERKLGNGKSLEDVANEHSMNTWEARNAHPDLVRRYEELVKNNPDYANLQKKLFDFYDKSHEAMSKGILDHILRTYEFEGTPEERASAVNDLYNGNLTDEIRAQIKDKIGPNALSQIENVKSLQKVEGPYAPLMRRGEHMVIGEYKLPEAPKAINRPLPNEYEFKNRKDAHDFATSQDLHFKAETVYYDPLTGERSTKEGAISQSGGPEKRYLVTLQNKHVEFHATRAEAEQSHAALKASNQFDKLGVGERRNYSNIENEFSGQGVQQLINSLHQQDFYKRASDSEKEGYRNVIKEAGIRSMSGNRVQSRRLPRRRVEGASNDILHNLTDYNTSQANYLAKLRYEEATAKAMSDMWDHVERNRYTNDYQEMTEAANEVERRARSQDPNDYSGAYTDWTRRLSTWSYIDRMMRPSHLILHQTHLPMVTVPYMVGRHGVKAFASMLKTWKEATRAYSAGGEDFLKSISDSLHKGTNYNDLFKESFGKAADGKQISQLFDHLTELGVLHPQSGIEVQKYMPSSQAKGMVGALDTGLQKMDTVFRHLTNATEAINRYVGAVSAYRLEFEKLTKEGNSSVDAHAKAIEYARNVISNTQGVFSATNAAPLFKNKWLKPFLQFRQFPQMIYNLLGKTAVQALKGATREEKIQAVASLASVLGMHTMMTGVLGGLPLEGFKIAGLVSKGLGLTEGDWSDVEQAVSSNLYKQLGPQAADLILHGVGRQMGIDVHHRLGLNSFFTFGMPDKLDSQSVWAFLGKAAAGAPGGLVEDTVKGIHKMTQGDIAGGMEQAFPLQALRDISRAWEGGSQQADSYQYGTSDKIARLLGFTPAKEAEFYEKKNETYHIIESYNQKRTELIKNWETAKPERKDVIWSKIQKWNADKPAQSQITKGELIKSMNRRKTSDRVNGIPVNKRNRYLLESAQNLS